MNIGLQARVIFTATTIKSFLDSEDESLINYYIMGKMNTFVKPENNTKTSNTCKSYYEHAHEIIKVTK